MPYPPAGAYRFLGAVEETETVVPADQADPGASRIIHLPVYELRYDADGWHGRAAVIGESWQVVAEELPPERGRRAGLRGGMIALVLFAGYFALAKIAPNPFIGFVAVAAAAAALYFVHSLRERARG